MNSKARKKIDTLIISDIHLGGFGVRTEALLKLLDEYDCKRLILNGDILNGLKFNRLNTAHWEILSKFRKLSANSEVVWVHGNHDARPSVLTKLLGISVFNYYTWEEKGKKFLAIHGHQFDKFLINNYILSHFVFFVYNTIKKLDKSNRFVRYLRKNNKTWKRSSTEVAQKAINMARILGVDYVFCGHTHKSLHVEKHKINFYNTSSWNESPSSYVIINDNVVNLHQVD